MAEELAKSVIEEKIAQEPVKEAEPKDKYADIEVEDAFDPMVDSEIKPPAEEFIAPDSKEPEADKKEPETKKPDKEKDKPADEKKEVKKEIEPEPGKEEKYSKRVQKRIDKLTYDKKSSDERADVAEAELEKLKEGAAEPEPSEAPATEEDKKAAADRAKLIDDHVNKIALKQAGEKPKEADFDNLDDYTIALAGWSADVKHYEFKAKEVVEAKQESSRKKALDFKSRMDKGFDLYEDFEDVALTPTLGITNAMVAAMQDIEEVPELVYYLGKHPKVVAKIARMEPISMAVEIGKIVARFTEDPESKPTETPLKNPKKTISKAPEPISAVSSSTSSKKDPEKMSHAEYRKWREDGGGT
ncbi:MAG: hypothetical protein E3J94_07315 [Desulfobacteraceae bacterium]|nr:MAG: hypothetical protein E3J94_07070 [Desulfobacteraceae bacterium]TES88963.1 MAG: hypothetical protein E3J94_07315 [Desulfobacteraceae bacterium]